MYKKNYSKLLRSNISSRYGIYINFEGRKFSGMESNLMNSDDNEEKD